MKNKPTLYAFSLLILLGACQDGASYSEEASLGFTNEFSDATPGDVLYDMVSAEEPMDDYARVSKAYTNMDYVSTGSNSSFLLSEDVEEIAVTQQPTAPQEPQKPAAGAGRKLIKTGRLRWDTDNVDSTRAALVAMLPTYEAFTSRDEVANQSYNVSGHMVIRVPADRFDALVSALTAGNIEFLEQNISTSDVTDRFVDLQARLKAKEELERRYLALLKEAGSVKEMLEVERSLGEVRTQIEQIEGQFRVLKDQISLSTLTLTFVEYKEDHTPATKPTPRVVRALITGWEILAELVVGIISLWPIVLLAGTGVWGIRSYRRRKRKAKE